MLIGSADANICLGVEVMVMRESNVKLPVSWARCWVAAAVTLEGVMLRKKSTSNPRLRVAGWWRPLAARRRLTRLDDVSMIEGRAETSKAQRLGDERVVGVDPATVGVDCSRQKQEE